MGSVNRRVTIAATLGDPAGIGPEVLLRALADERTLSLANWVVVGDGSLLDRAGAATGVPLPKSVRVMDTGQLAVSGFAPGRISAACGRASLDYVRRATQLCLDGEADAMVTAPINKEAVALSYPHFTGHTEFIGDLCGVREPRMMLVNERLRVIHVSTHVALRSACDLHEEKIEETIRLGHRALEDLGCEHPRIAVCGLNPHAGEKGLFGSEDASIIAPAVCGARAAGIACEGPLAADTVFLKAVRGFYDLVVVMYHDQGHIPMKLLDFEHTVNVSLGLPIIRTSVDHGTAFDIAWKNKADSNSMKAAMRLASQMAARHLCRC